MRYMILMEDLWIKRQIYSKMELELMRYTEPAKRARAIGDVCYE
jgi:hypothetical protein